LISKFSCVALSLYLIYLTVLSVKVCSSHGNTWGVTPGVPRADVCALEVSSEGFDQIIPVGDLHRRQMLQPCSGGVGEEQGEVADDEVVIICST
jgi:hypothetical protein